MNESERMQRYRREDDPEFRDKVDEILADRIAALLNHSEIDKYCMVDAYYYDFSGIPYKIREKQEVYRDAYLVFGITKKGEIVSKWVDRWDLDNDDPIVDGKVIPSERKETSIPFINSHFDPNLLSTLAPGILKMFRYKKEL